MLWVSSRPLPRLEGSQRSRTGALPVGLREDQQQRPRRTERGRALQLRRAEAHQPVRACVGRAQPLSQEGTKAPERPGGLSAHRVPPPRGQKAQAARPAGGSAATDAPRSARFPLRVTRRNLGGAATQLWEPWSGRGRCIQDPGEVQPEMVGHRGAPWGTGVPGERSCAWPPGHQCSGSLGPQDWSLGLQDAARCVWICPVPLWGKNHPKWAFRHRHIPLHSMVFRLNVHFSFLPGDALLTSAAPAPAPGRGLTTCGSEPRALDESLG